MSNPFFDHPILNSPYATPFFLSGSGYIEGTLFPRTMSDFSLMDEFNKMIDGLMQGRNWK